MDIRVFHWETFKQQKPQKSLVAHLVNEMIENSSKSTSNPNLGLTTIYSKIFSAKIKKRVSNPSYQNFDISPKIFKISQKYIRSSQKYIRCAQVIIRSSQANIIYAQANIRSSQEKIRACPETKKWLPGIKIAAQNQSRLSKISLPEFMTGCPE